jgi:mono/diheme cytochrome c family protein
MKRVAALVVAAALCAGCGPKAEGKTGAELYEVSCAGCHGPDLSGSGGVGIGRDIGPGSNADIALSDEQIAGVIEVGPGSMPSFGRSLDDEQIASLVAYIRSVQDG